jgi:hypothetical protein
MMAPYGRVRVPTARGRHTWNGRALEPVTVARRVLERRPDHHTPGVDSRASHLPGPEPRFAGRVA